jgi:signal transduction histidine kinase/ligand-binding sensor domain-containing protein
VKIIRLTLVFLIVIFDFGISARNRIPVHILHQSPLKLAYSVNIWNTENGLPQNTVNKIVQTRDKFIWIATNDGLLRFDGLKFTLFNISNTPQLRSNRIIGLHEDEYGTLWISTENCKVTVYRNRQFTEIDDKGLLSGFISPFAEDQYGNVWICTNDILVRFTNYEIVFFQKINLFHDNFRRSLLWDKNTLYIGGSSAYKYVNGKVSAIPEFYHKFILSIIKSKSGDILFGSRVGIYRATNAGMQLDQLYKGEEDNAPFAMVEEPDGELWLAHNNAFVDISDKNNFTELKSEYIAHDYAQTMLCDHEGNIWTGTFSSGLIRLKKQCFSTISTVNGLSNNIIYPILQATSGTIYIGTNLGGLNKIEKRKISHVADPFYIKPTVAVWSLFEDSRKNIWAGTFGDGPVKISGNTFISYRTDEWSSARIIFAISEDREKNMWFGTMNGVFKYDGHTVANYTTKSGLVHNEVKCIYLDSDGTLWFGTSGGISHFDGKHFSNITSRNGLSSDFVRVITKDKQGSYWVGTYGGGLNRIKNGKIVIINRACGLFDDNVSAIAQDDFGYFWMTCNKGIYRVSKKELDDFADGKVKTIHCLSYDKSDGMLSNECNGGCQPSFCRTNDGQLYFPTLKGVVCVNPAKLPPPRPSVAPIIESMFIDDKAVLFQDTIFIGPDYERVGINYTTVNFTDPHNVRFRYFIDGLFTSWTAPSENRFALLTKIPPGTYRFEVISCNDDGIWNDKPTVLTLVIRAHFYQTAWFYVGLFLLIPIGVVFFSLFRIRLLEHQTKQLNQLVAEKTRDLSDEKLKTEAAYDEMRLAKEIADQEKDKAQKANFQKTELINILTHDLKNPMISINGGATLINENPEDIDLVKHMGEIIASSSEHMTELINQLHEHNKLEEYYVKLESKPVDIVELTKAVIRKNELQALRKQQRIIFSANIPEGQTVLADEAKLQSVLDNLVSNAVKFSPHEKAIWVNITNARKTLRISVKDEGPGLSKNDLKLVFGKFQRLSARPTGDEISTGLGLSIVKQIAELHKWKVWVESELGKGAEFIIEIPML